MLHSLRDTSCQLLKRQGPIQHKPWPIQTVTYCQDCYILSRQLHTVKTGTYCHDSYRNLQKVTESCQQIARKLPEIARKLPESCQKVARKLSGSCQRAVRE